MKFFYRNTRLGIVAASLVIMSLPISSSSVYIISAMLVGTIGLMHGATDHVLFMNSRGKLSRERIPKRFFLEYLGILVLYGVIWFLVPSLAFFLFILVSSYHFGQTQLQYLNLSEKNWAKKLTYAFWGLGVLNIIVFLNPVESEGLIYSVFPNQWVISLFDFNSFYVATASGVMCILVVLFTTSKSRKSQVILELIEVVVIFIFSYFSNLALSFALFFALWHALRASQVQIDKLKKNEHFRAKDFIRHSLPFTLISLFGISLLILASQYLESQIMPEMLFLIAISVLTMPHMVIYEQFYNYHDD